MASEAFSYEGASYRAFQLFCQMAARGDTCFPVYSGDLALALGIPHRWVKDLIEMHFKSLRSSYGTRIHFVRYKRRGQSRSMRGYILPFQAAAQLIYQLEEMGFHFAQILRPMLQCTPVLYSCFVPGNFKDSLN